MARVANADRQRLMCVGDEILGRNVLVRNNAIKIFVAAD